MDDVIERLISDKEERNKWLGVYIGVLAVLLAICGVGVLMLLGRAVVRTRFA
jgi:hypothetical protein